MRTALAVTVLTVAFGLTVQAAPAAPPTGPSSCTAESIRATLVDFASAFDRGDREALDRIFATEPDFQWYSTAGREGAAAKRRGTLLAYFANRQARGERLALRRFRFTGNAPHYGNFEMTMRRRIPGVAGGRWLPVPGKGAAVCRDGLTRLIVTTFGRAGGR